MNPRIDFNDENSNPTNHPSLSDLLHARVSRRDVLRTGALLTGAALMPLPLAARTPAPVSVTPLLSFAAVAKSTADQVSVPAGYSAAVLYALGDPLRAATPAYKNDGTDLDFEHRAGDHHDGMEWFGLDKQGHPSASSTTRGLLAINHEATTDEQLSSFFIHAHGGTTTLPRPASEVDKELAIHGLSFVEVRKEGAQWRTVTDAPLNRRVTLHTPIDIAGPARGHPLLITQHAPRAEVTRGTLNNCGTGTTPWGTMLTGEENWFGYFHRHANDDAARADQSVVALNRYGRKQGDASRHGWESAGAHDKYTRWNNSKTGSSSDGSDDYRNEMNHFGYIVEVDPYHPNRRAKKRTAMGRFAHESAAYGLPKARQPLHFYMGDDARNEYIYKWVSRELWNPADAHAADPLAVGDKYLDHGTLYVAKFHASGQGEWIELSMNNPTVTQYSAYKFRDQADICVHARLAGDAVGATKMDRPEWNSVHPSTGEVYFTLTNNSNRSLNPEKKEQLMPDAANPRAYTDMKKDKAQNGNPNGHIVRLREQRGRGAMRFTWDIYLFGAKAMADAQNINLSGLTEDQDFSSPDGLAFSKNTGLCWIQTDDSAYTDRSNCMMLAAIPGQVGDGQSVTLPHRRADGSAAPVTTFVGKKPSNMTLKRFLVGPKDCEITGFCETPDGRTLFINIQHPGEGTKQANIDNPSLYSSQWPANAGYGQGLRPRSATIVITKDDGGIIGS